MTTKKSRAIWLSLVAGAVLILGVIVIGAMAQDKRLQASTDSAHPSSTAASLNLERRVEADPTAMGKVDAPVVMVEYSDYRCPFCGVFARETLPELVKEYVDSGQLRIEWRDLPVLGVESLGAAVAGRAAGEQGKFWEFNEAVYAAAPARGKAALSEPDLLKIAEQIGVPDMATFAKDLQSPELAARVQQDLREGMQLGMNSTPVFVINDQPIAGAQPLDVFRSTIDAALAKAK
ncbi:DsbA family protein [Arthrobacter sp. GMC3]|uniref:DsbA family protein n=1 Tax=Arthrobacter sp. GMC3 TaxID=2058894 RepID=UPI000CE2E8A7|nr:DsbA family protein [Arthrobacter sp. GMC3]